MAAAVRYCGSCGAPNPPAGARCGQCGAILAPVLDEPPPPRANWLVWGLAAGAVLAFAITLGVLAVLLNTSNPGGRSTCPPDC
ncbi:MAG: hypothetical protein ABI838_06910, partial [Chloroflexota bacterium]